MHKNVSSLIGDFKQELPEFLQNPGGHLYWERPWLAFDLETTNLDYGDALNPKNHLVCAAWATSDDYSMRYTRGDEFNQHDLLADIERVLDAGGFLIAHNAKFECHWLKRCGIDLHKVLTYDTMLGEYVLGGNRWTYAHLSLHKLNTKYGGTGKMKIVDALISGGVCPSQIPHDLLKARVCKDVADMMEIFYPQRQKLEDRGQLDIAFTRNILTPCLTDIESNGIALNPDRVYEEYEKAFVEMADIQREIDKMMDGRNWRSTKQKAEFLYDILKFKELKVRGKPKKTKGGDRATDVNTLEKLVATNKKQRAFVELMAKASTANAALTKTLEFFKGIVDEYDGQFYGSFNQASTATQRLSSSGKKTMFKQFDKGKSTQFQNMPRQYKDLMQPKNKGWYMGECDGSQLEFRGAAFLGQDEQAIFDIRNDVDIHLFTAATLNDIAEAAVDKYMRQNAKPDTFKPLYGGSSGTPAQQRYYEAFREKYSGVFEEQTRWTFDVLKTKKLTTQWGLTYFWPYTRMSKSGYIDNTASIFNYPIQAFSTAEIIPVAVVYLWHRMYYNDMQSIIVNTVHDSAICEVHPTECDLWKRLSLHTFTADVYGYLKEVYDIDFNVPLGAGISLGSRWSAPDTVETEINVEPDGEFWFKGTRSEINPSDGAVKAWDTISGMQKESA